MPELPTPADLVHRVQRRLSADRLPPEPAHLARAVRAESPGVVDDARMLTLIHHLEQELVGCGPLADLLADPATTDVVVNSPTDVRIDRGHGWEAAPVAFADEAAVQRLARRLAMLAGGRLDDAHPFVDGRLPDGTRLHAVLPPLSPAGTCLSLRVLRHGRFDLATLGAAGMFPGMTAAALHGIIDARLAFLISGGTGTGKTTLLDAMLGRVDPAERIVTVEDAEELRPAHPHVIRLVSRPANIEGAGGVTMRELVRQALRMRPDRLVVGEVRGAEIVEMMGALSTGHDGGAGTVHANGSRDVPARLAALAAMAGVDRAGLFGQLAGAVQVVVHLRRSAGVRRLAELAVLDTTAGGEVIAVPAVVEGRPTPDGGERLAAALRSRGVGAPW